MKLWFVPCDLWHVDPLLGDSSDAGVIGAKVASSWAGLGAEARERGGIARHGGLVLVDRAGLQMNGWRRGKHKRLNTWTCELCRDGGGPWSVGPSSSSLGFPHYLFEVRDLFWRQAGSVLSEHMLR